MRTSGPSTFDGRCAGWQLLMVLCCLCLWLPVSARAASPAPEDSEDRIVDEDRIADEGRIVDESRIADEGRIVDGGASDVAPAETWSTLTTGGSYRVEIEADPHPIPLNEMFSLRFRVTRAETKDPAESEGGEEESDTTSESDLVSGAVITATARMPEHQHGTNFEPRVTSHGDGTATGVGFLWHMEGLWDLRVGVAAGGKMEWAVLSFELEPPGLDQR